MAEECKQVIWINRYNSRISRIIGDNKDLVEIAIKKLKGKKAADEEKLTNEMILEGRDAMVNSITYMFREISVTQQIPNQWKTMRIKSIHKKKINATNG